ncbi:hypothetical protein [Gordonia sp. (in: high G+C Gram-positive bacteria)]|jgi:hypothetical protein|uniref:hypothetical protein n=1 Tax=Gordonia sp. (in: high G+C Gram-positive bacteria) TaxID=84139 RepID=UPI001DE59913|nr:hypothetical protein [Gordonia sp. (in: high G+C Gram-positive bacteria)]MCB1296812.1 hypothetical protein [Gordonia sp. (in: high G+C Gram-positive bacteria)]HMS76378.1 hypothetical protein [Gordonia sp. (in: high G+C Gram-positive bacteria)]HQV16703.1 hypothetical protein [Gordonia sp. (in: high G+C Gram-positive bacteria)]
MTAWRGAAPPIPIGRGSAITPIVVGPFLAPVIAEADVAASSQELAMLSVS